MEVKFNKTGPDAVPVESTVTASAATTPAVAEQPQPKTQEVAKIGASGIPLGDDLPGFDEVMFPRLNLVHAVGGLKDSFTPGELVFDQRTVLFSPPVVKAGKTEKEATPPVNITVIGIISKRFTEKIEGGIGGMTVNTEAEVRANGGTLDYNEWKSKKAEGMKRFENINDMLVAIRRPAHVADDDTVFAFPVGAHKYAIGKWAVKGTAYTHAFKKVLAYARIATVLRSGYPSHSFALSTRIEPRPPNPYWVPVLIPAEKSSLEFMEFVKQIVNPTA